MAFESHARRALRQKRAFPQMVFPRRGFKQNNDAPSGIGPRKHSGSLEGSPGPWVSRGAQHPMGVTLNLRPVT